MLKVSLRNNKAEVIKVPNHVTSEGWWAAVKSDGKNVTSNGTTYRTEDITGVTEVKPTTGFTNMEGI